MEKKDIRYRKVYRDLKQLYLDLDDNLSRAKKFYEEEEIHSCCREGCFACCSQLVVATRWEAQEAALFLKSLPDFDRYWQKLASWYAKTKGLLQQRPKKEAEWEEFAGTYRRLEEPCPFLFEGRCAIYPVRPAPCRLLYVSGSPEACADPDGEFDQLGWFEEAADPALSILLEKSEAGVFPLLVASALS
ncbi:MAG TPA: YkgJ family cysteine cluster protein [Chroococcales cyanobacterium]|jgi:Fe-S-cluster containining protein